LSATLKVFGFFCEAFLRAFLFALVYAIVCSLIFAVLAVVTPLFSVSGALPQPIGLIMLWGAGLLATGAAAMAGAVVSVSAILTRRLTLLLLVSIAAALAPVLFFIARGDGIVVQLAWILVPAAALIGAVSLLSARSAGLLDRDRRIVQDLWREGAA
jgi:hypothetical protein